MIHVVCGTRVGCKYLDRWNTMSFFSSFVPLLLLIYYLSFVDLFNLCMYV